MTIVRYLALTVPSMIMMVCVVAGCSASPGAALSFALLAYAVAFAVYRARLEEQLGPPTHWTDRIGAVAVPMLCAGTGATAAVMAVAGLCVICGTASPAVLTALVLVAAVPLWRRWGSPALVIVVTQTPGRPGHRRAQRTGPDGAQVNLADAVNDAMSAVIAEMTVEQLCGAWRRSWLVVLDRNSDPDHWDQLSAIRRGYLDELERRDPAGVARWLDSGARAGGNPSKFLTTARSPGEFHDDNGPATDHQLTD